MCAMQKTMRLWPLKIPNSRPNLEVESKTKGDILWIENVQEPAIDIYLPSKTKGRTRAIVICPGGGYGGLAYDIEGIDVAEWLKSLGFAAFVLKYRLPISSGVLEGHKAPLQDVQRAIRTLRHHADEWNLYVDQIGVMGFSAGGHLAAMSATRYEIHDTILSDEIDAISARPDFLMLLYPVISMKSSCVHMGSRANLLGEHPSHKLIHDYSAEAHVSHLTPPTFIVHAIDDKSVHVLNSILFYRALKKENVKSRLHLYQNGGHGFGLAFGQAPLNSWTTRLLEFIENLP